MSKKNKKKKHRTRRQIFRRVFFLSMLIFTLMGFGLLYAYNLLDKIESAEIPTNDKELGIKEDVFEDKKIINILLFGVDEKNSQHTGRSDSIMIATLDKQHKKIKLTSIMRDTYLDIPGKGMDKINHAYSIGGPELAIKTINQNFDMNIREYATVDFFGLEKIIDTLGGLEVNVKPNEVSFINNGVRNMNKLDGKNGKLLQSSGNITLTGRQAVAYSRIRKTGNGDYERTERQRIVLEKIINKGLNAGITKYPALLDAMLPHVETSLSKSEILSYGTSVITSGIKTIDKFRIPADGYVEDARINGISYVVPVELEDNVKILHTFIYDDKKPEDEKSGTMNSNNNKN